MKKQMKKHSLIHKIIGATVMVTTIFLVGYFLLWIIAMIRNFCIDNPIMFIPIFLIIMKMLIEIIKE